MEIKDIDVGGVVLKIECSLCPACKAMEPTWKKVQEDNQCKFFTINTDQYPEVADRFSIMAVPTFIALQDGNELSRIVGRTDKISLQKLIGMV